MLLFLSLTAAGLPLLSGGRGGLVWFTTSPSAGYPYGWLLGVVVVVGVGDGGSDAMASDAMVAMVAIGDRDAMTGDESASDDADASDAVANVSDAMCADGCPLVTWRCAAVRHAGPPSLPAAR